MSAASLSNDLMTVTTAVNAIIKITPQPSSVLLATLNFLSHTTNLKIFQTAKALRAGSETQVTAFAASGSPDNVFEVHLSNPLIGPCSEMVSNSAMGRGDRQPPRKPDELNIDVSNLGAPCGSQWSEGPNGGTLREDGRSPSGD
jgi:hypothetical protein